jgi:hypothetical protein
MLKELRDDQQSLISYINQQTLLYDERYANLMNKIQKGADERASINEKLDLLMFMPNGALTDLTAPQPGLAIGDDLLDFTYSGDQGSVPPSFQQS